MVIDLFRKDRKGVSLMMGYVLLIVIAIVIAVLVYIFLQLYLPKDRAECRQGITITIDDLECDIANNKLNIQMTNRGLFTVDRVQIRVGDEGRIAKDLINGVGVDDYKFRMPCDTGVDPECDNPVQYYEELLPNWFSSGEFSYASAGTKEVEVQPAMLIEGELVLCEQSTVSKIVVCTP
jgi:hypothetical protein